MIALSYSSMKDLECPFRFHALRVAKTYKEPETKAMRLGSEVARIIEEYRLHCYRAGISSDLGFLSDVQCDHEVKELLNSFARTEFATVPTEVDSVLIEGQPLNGREKIGGMAYDSGLNFLGHGKNAWLNKDVAFRAKVDFAYKIGTEIFIIDDKTGFGTGDKEQASIYAALITTTGTHEKVTVIFDYLRDRTSESYEFLPYDPDTLERIHSAIKEANTRTEWPAVPCSRCEWCTVPGCPVRKSASTALVSHKGSPVISIPSELTTPEIAQNALNFVLFAENIVGQVKDLLKAYVEENGPVYSAGKVAQFIDKETWKPKDLSSLCAALVQFGTPKELLWNELSLTKTALEKIIKKAKLEAKQAWIDAYLEKKSSKAFGINKDKTI